MVAGRLPLVRGALADLQVPQPAAERAEEGEYENLDHDEPDLDPWGPTGLGNVGHCGCLPLSVRGRLCVMLVCVMLVRVKRVRSEHACVKRVCASRTHAYE
ncbi:hypothetical protein GCM10010521_73830 [Streptomyces rameus]|uniref:Uncharacterized protein n=1 Tax=Streptomyces rameus TaxID=68261 RepID=A0ABP6HPR3_9ACTN